MILSTPLEEFDKAIHFRPISSSCILKFWVFLSETNVIQCFGIPSKLPVMVPPSPTCSLWTISFFLLLLTVKIVKVLRKFWIIFCDIFGQQVSSRKSRIYFSPNVPLLRRKDIYNCLNLPSTPFLGKYLGFPLKQHGSPI